MIGRLPGYGAFARADVADAKRRRPDVDLSDYAARRGLEMLGSRNAAGFFAALPLDEQLQFNVLRGELPGGEQGILFHEVLALPVSPEGGVAGADGLFGYVYNSPGGGFRARHVLANLVPWGDLATDILADIRRPTPHRTDRLADCIGIPCTTAAVLVPEAALEESTRDLSMDRPYAKVEVRYGTLIVRVNGYLRDDAELDELARLACSLTREQRGAGERAADRRPFDRPLPPPGDEVPPPWADPLDAYAWKHGLCLEDPAAYHRAFPSLAVPGRAFGVLRGELAPGVVGRVAWHTEKPIETNNDGRNAVLLPTTAAPTPRTGVRLPDEPLNYWIGDGILAVWELRSKELRGDLGDMEALVERALALR
jgi:hypothetical protein